MNPCPTLPVTGAGTGVLLAAAAIFVITGVLILRYGRRTAPLAALLILAASATVAIPAEAAADCEPATGAATTTVATTATTAAPADETSTTDASGSTTTEAAESSTTTSTSTTSTSSTTSSTSSTTTTTTLPAPIAQDDSFPYEPGVSFSFNYLDNDSLFDLDPIGGSSFTNVSCIGQLSFNPLTGAVTATIEGTQAWAGDVDCTATYTIVTAGGSSTATITFVASTPAQPTPPIARDDDYTIEAGEPFDVNLFDNDDLFGLPATADSASQGDCGDFGGFSYDVMTGQVSSTGLSDSCFMVYIIETAGGSSSARATFTVT